jgi:hypothetical protein
MATTTSITTSYAGESAGEFISAALLSNDTIAKGGLTIKPNIKFKQVVRNLSTDGLLADATCDFADTSTITQVERILEPKSLQVNLELCKADFRDDWDAIQMGYSAHDVMPKSFSDYLIGYVAAKVAAQNEVAIWSGATGTGGEFNGFETLLALDANLPAAQEVAGTTVTAANVVAELGKIVDAIPTQLYGKEDAYIYVSSNIYRAYVRALGTLGFVDRFNNQNMGDVMFDGVKLFVAPGMSDNTAIFAQKSNLFFGTGLMNDTNTVKVLDMADLDGSENVRFIMRMTAGVQYGNVSDIVTYGITNAAN